MPPRDPIARRAYQQRWRQANRDKINAYHRTYRKEFPDRVHAWDAHNRKAKQLRATYRLDKKKYDEMLLEQGNACKICRVEFTETRVPHVDHDHETKQVRGLLCSLCNGGLGMFEDNPILLVKAYMYLLGEPPVTVTQL